MYVDDHGKFASSALNIRHGLVLESEHGITESIPVYESSHLFLLNKSEYYYFVDYCVLNATRQIQFDRLDIIE
jgi:hypothetical protein